MSSLSLRWRLVALGMVASLVPLLALVAVVFAVDSDQVVETTDSTNIEVTTTAGVSPWVPVTAALLMAPAAALVWIWSSRAVQPILDITSIATDIQAGELDRRIGLNAAPQEVQALGDSFDEMLDRLEQASTSQRQLIEDTSHELRTPLAALAVNTEVIRNHRSPTLDDYRQSIERSHALIERLRRTIETQLRGARARTQMSEQTNNDLMAILHAESAHANGLANHPAVNVSGPTTLRLGIDGEAVARALRNLIENAARVTPRGGVVDVDVTRHRDGVHLSVTDAGPGIDADDRGRIFDRYYSTDAEGHGIGLALVKQVADANGHIQVESPVAEGTGTRFTIVFANP